MRRTTPTRNLPFRGGRERVAVGVIRNGVYEQSTKLTHSVPRSTFSAVRYYRTVLCVSLQGSLDSLLKSGSIHALLAERNAPKIDPHRLIPSDLHPRLPAGPDHVGWSSTSRRFFSSDSRPWQISWMETLFAFSQRWVPFGIFSTYSCLNSLEITNHINVTG
jgi:hypothetical protein